MHLSEQIAEKAAGALNTGFTAILLQFSFANWIINYPIVSLFAANWHIGELWGGERGQGGPRGKQGGANRFSFAIMYTHATHGEMCNHLNLHCEVPLAVAMRSYL